MAKLIDEKKQELIHSISEKLSQAENEQIVLDEDKEVYLFNGDTEEQLGECFRIEFLSQTHLMGQTQVYVWVDTDESNPNPREGWLLDDCTEYELRLIYDAFFGDDDDEYGCPTHDSAELIDMLDLDESMDCDTIFEKVFDYLDDNEDGQIPRSIVSSTADGITAEICCHFGIEFHKNE